MNTFDIHIKDKHPIIHSGTDILLLDTGASHTIHQTDTLEFCGTRYNCVTNFLGIDTKSISKMVGTPITTLLGADVLSDYYVLLDYRGCTARFSKKPIPFEGRAMPMTTYMGVPIIELTIAGSPVRCFLDTGAKLSYLPMEITRDYPNQGVVEDFYMLIGTFHSESYKVPTAFLDNELTIICGNLPEPLQLTIARAGVRGIVGSDFFNTFKVLLHLGQQELHIAPYA